MKEVGADKEGGGTVKRIIALVLFVLLLPISASAELQIHFLDVGQGDCTIVLCDGEAMVIDGGPRASASYVYNYVRKTLQLNLRNRPW